MLKEFKIKERAAEEQYLRDALENNDWNIARTAREIGCAISTLRSMIKRHPRLSGDAATNIKGRGAPRKQEPKK